MRYSKEEKAIINDLKSGIKDFKKSSRLNLHVQDMRKKVAETKLEFFKKGLRFRHISNKKQRSLKYKNATL